MGYKCPRCGKPIEVRWLRPTQLPGGGPSLGLMYILGAPFVRRFVCPEHGRLPRREFPVADRRRMLAGAVARSLVALMGLLVLGGGLVWLAR